jgi:hypothetical protein
MLPLNVIAEVGVGATGVSLPQAVSRTSAAKPADK